MHLFLCLLLWMPEIGAGVTGTHLHKIDEAPVGVYGRVFLNFTGVRHWTQRGHVIQARQARWSESKSVRGSTDWERSAKLAPGSGISIGGILQPILAASSSTIRHVIPLFVLISAIRSCSTAEPRSELYTIFNQQSDSAIGFKDSENTPSRRNSVSIFAVSGCGADYRRGTSGSRIHRAQSCVCRQVRPRYVRRQAG